MDNESEWKKNYTNIILLFFCRSYEQGCHLLALFLWHALLIILLVILGRWNMFKSCQTPSCVSEENRKSLLQLLGQQSADLWYRLHFSNTMYKTRASPAWIYINKSWSFIKFIKDPYLIKLKNVNKRVVHCRFQHFVFANICVDL